MTSLKLFSPFKLFQKETLKIPILEFEKVLFFCPFCNLRLEKICCGKKWFLKCPQCEKFFSDRRKQ
jgi:hypothetical protein